MEPEPSSGSVTITKAGCRIKSGSDAAVGATANGAAGDVVDGFAAQHGMTTPSGQHEQGLASTLVTTAQACADFAERHGATASRRLKMSASTVFITLSIVEFGKTAKLFLVDAPLQLALMAWQRTPFVPANRMVLNNRRVDGEG